LFCGVRRFYQPSKTRTVVLFKISRRVNDTHSRFSW